MYGKLNTLRACGIIVIVVLLIFALLSLFVSNVFWHIAKIFIGLIGLAVCKHILSAKIVNYEDCGGLLFIMVIFFLMIVGGVLSLI